MELLPFVDCHVHFWTLRHPTLRWGFLTDSSTHAIIGNIDGVRVQQFSVPEYEAQTRFSAVSKVVHVQAAFDTVDPVEETRWVQSLADEHGIPTAILGEVALGEVGARQQLDAHLEFPAFRGLRNRDDPARFADPQWRRGYRLLAEDDLVFTHVVGVEHLGEAARLAAAHPEVTFCLDQAGMPLSRDPEYFTAWRAGLAELAAVDGTACKISSLGMVDHRWTVDSLRPWVRACIDTFGPDRCVFGSNWPMDSLFSAYPDLVGAYRTLVAEYSPSEQAALLAGNAERMFRI